MSKIVSVSLVVLALAVHPGRAAVLELVRGGRPLAGIWFEEAPSEAGGITDRQAAEELVRVVKIMSGVELALNGVAPGTAAAVKPPAIVMGAVARRVGLDVKAKSSGGKLGFYPYNYNLADALLPFTKFDYYKRLIKVVREAGISELAWIPESMDSWATHAPHHYLCIRMLWNTGIDVDAELERFFTGFYGKAADPMRSYWLRIDNAYATTPVHAGSSYGQHRIWTPELLEASRTDIDRAATLAGNPREREAVALAEAGLRGAELFIEIWNAIGKYDFQGALQAQNRLGTLVAEKGTITNAPSWFHERYAFGYYKTFVGRTVEGGAQALGGDARLLVKLPDLWRFSKDEKGEGAAHGWHKPDFDDGAWGEMGTFSTSWADAGIDYYLGDAWYRATFTAPAERGGDLRLWFGGFDENIDVYLNGVHLGEKCGFAKPAEYGEIARHLRDGVNTLAVRVSAGSLAELGTGGIMMPVMIYRAATSALPADAPAGGKGGAGYEM